MANELEAYKFDTLIVVVRRIGHSKLFRVQIVGADEEFVTHVYAPDHVTAAHEVIEEMNFANENPDAFFIRRRSWIRKIANESSEKKKEWAHVHEYFEYARRHQITLWRAVEAIRNSEVRQIARLIYE